MRSRRRQSQTSPRAAVLARALASLTMMLVTILFLTSCTPSSMGLTDVELRYRVGEGETTKALAKAIRARLALAHITADVEHAGDREMTVTVDHALVSATEELLAWNGGVSAYAPKTNEAITLDSTNLTQVDGEWVGRRAVLTAAIAHAKLPDDVRVLYASRGDGRFRARIVQKTPAFVVMPGHVDDRGVAGSVYITPKSITPGAGAESSAPSSQYVFTVGSTVLGEGTTPTDAAPLVLTFGHSLRAYAVAHETKQMLGARKLPEMTRIGATPLPKNIRLFLGCIAVPFVVSFVWLWFIRRFDRAHPEPIWLMLLTFALGNLAVLPAAFLERTISSLSPYSDPSLSTMGARASALWLSIPVFTLVIGVVEEGMKVLAASVAYKRHEFDEPVDGIVYGVAASLGFAAAENLRYFAMGRLAPQLVCARAFMTVPAHMFFGAIWGYGFGEALTRKRSRKWLFFALAALSHGTYDAFLSTDDAGTAATILVLVLAATFVVLLRRSLRFGIVVNDADDAKQIDPKSRTRFPMGNRAAFVAAVAGLHVSAFVLFLLGAVYQSYRHRVGVYFFSGSAVLLLLFGVMLYLVAATLPLDAVLDARGVTYAGTTRAWTKIRGTKLFRRALLVESDEGTLLVGPGKVEMLQALAHDIDTRVTPQEAARLL